MGEIKASRDPTLFGRPTVKNGQERSAEIPWVRGYIYIYVGTAHP